jgi:hypothetical protein
MMTTFPGNPYALLINSVVTEVVYMQSYSSEEIEEALKNHSYDEVISCAAHGKEIYVDQERIGAHFVFEKPHSSWQLDKETGDWVAPIAEPVEPHIQHAWNESTLSWDICGSCGDNSLDDLILKEKINGY